jgi:phasin family protein
MSQQLESIRSAQKASAETAMALMKSSLDTIERLAALNLNTMRDALAASAAQSGKMMSASDFGAAAALQQEAAQPSLQLTRAYYHRVYDLMTEMQEQLTKVMQAHYSAMSESASAVTSQVVAGAPAGGEAFAAAMKTMLDASTQTFERLNEMSHQVQANTREVSAAPVPDQGTKAEAAKSKPAGKGKK